MSRRRGMAGVLVGLAALVLLVLWLLRSGPAQPDAEKVEILEPDRRPPGQEVSGKSAPATSIEALAESATHSPLRPPSAVEALSADAKATQPERVRVGALAGEGRPLQDVLTERWPDLPELAASWTTDITGPPPTERELGFGLFHRLSSENERLQIPGYVCTLSIDAPLPVRVVLHAGSTLVGMQVVSTHDDDIWFRLEPTAVDDLTGVVKGRVVAKDTRAALSQSTVAAWRDMDFLPFGRPAAERPTNGGDFVLEGLPAGVTFLGVIAEGYERQVLKIQVPRGRGLDLGSIELDPAVPCRGQVLDSHGTPVPAAVTLRPLDAGADMLETLVFSQGVLTENDGRFEIPRLGRDRYLLRAESRKPAGDDHQARYLLLDTLDATPQELMITLQPQTRYELRGVYDRQSWSALDLVNESGVPLISYDDVMLRVMSQFERPEPFWDRLPPGHYSIRLAKQSRVVWVKDFDVGAEPLTIELPP